MIALIKEKRAREILSIYQLAWETQDSKKIPEIFHKDATYREHAYQPEMNGRDEIIQYWDKRVKKEQANIDFKLINMFIDGDVIIAEWECAFDQLLENQRKKIREVAILVTEDGKIRSLREYWASKLIKDFV